MPNKIAQVVFGLPLEGPFDYVIPPELQDSVRPGARVHVSFGRKPEVGFVIGTLARSRFKELKPVLASLDRTPALDGAMMTLTRTMAEHYGCSWGEAIDAALPAALRTKKRLESDRPEPRKASSVGTAHVLIVHGNVSPWDSVGGRIRETIGRGEQVLILVPESHAVAGVQSQLRLCGLPEPAVFDKHLSPARELEAWEKMRSGEAPVAVGTRSAVFVPLARPGLIVLWDEENLSYKQEQSPFYHAREIALFRSRIEGCPVLIVSSSPTAEIWAATQRKKISRTVLEGGTLSPLGLIDLTNFNPAKSPLVSFPLQTAVQKTLETQGRVLLFLNRRGFSTSARCEQCGHAIKCPRCDVQLTYLYSRKKLVCRMCGHAAEVQDHCPQCRSAYMRYTGTGIEKLESELARYFPGARLGVFDKETERLPSVDIIVATQAALRVLDEFRPSLIGVLAVDADLNRADFRSAQRVFAFLTQLRRSGAGKVLVQTAQSGNYCLRAAMNGDLESFYSEELRLRKELGFPPYRHLVEIGLRGRKEESVLEQANALYNKLTSAAQEGIEVMDPQPHFVPKLRDQYRFHIMVKTGAVRPAIVLVKETLKALKRRTNVIVTVNVDP